MSQVFANSGKALSDDNHPSALPHESSNGKAPIHHVHVAMIESHVNYILGCLRLMDHKRLRTVEVRPEIQEAFNKEIQRRMQGTVWVSGCSSWYLDARGKNTTIWPGFTFEFWRRTRRFDRQHYKLVPQ